MIITVKKTEKKNSFLSFENPTGIGPIKPKNENLKSDSLVLAPLTKAEPIVIIKIPIKTNKIPILIRVDWFIPFKKIIQCFLHIIYFNQINIEFIFKILAKTYFFYNEVIFMRGKII